MTPRHASSISPELSVPPERLAVTQSWTATSLRSSGPPKTTLNQVRAVKYIVLIAYYCPDGISPCWYVVPAHRVVALVARKTRGQHTENPFESATLNIRDLADYRVDDETQLRTQVLAAVHDSARYTDLQAEMARILRESRSLASDSRERVSVVLHRHGLA
ncbi:MAG TPA: hypothetical protein VIJ66_03430 [Solirubrobacteraceae bacterium]